MSLKFEAELTLGRFRYRAAFEADNELLVLFGHSGAGKSITLRLLAGLLHPTRGHIEINGKVVTDTGRGLFVPPQERNVGYVVQELALFPHMTVAQNVGFGIPARQRKQRARKVDEMLSLLDMGEFADRMPGSLSGGQRQRVALARALAREADVLLLDEPFSALDESLREGLRRELLRIRRELGLPVVFVTHDLREAHLLADRLAVFDAGSLLQFGPREEVFRHPANARVAELTGVTNVLEARFIRANGGIVELACAGLNLRAPAPDARPLVEGETVDVAIRAERVNLRRRAPEELEGTNVMRGRVVEDFGYGSVHRLTIEPEGPGPRLTVELAARPYEVLDVAHQGDWTLELPADDLHVMKRAAP